MALEWPQHFSHYKSMGILPDAQGQLTLQSEVQPSIPLDLLIPTEMTSIEALVENEKLMTTPKKLKIMLCNLF